MSLFSFKSTLCQLFMRKLIDYLILLILILAFFAIVFICSNQVYRSGVRLYEAFWSSREWGVTSGVITDINVDPGCGRRGRSFFLSLHYQYQVGTTNYKNYQVTFDTDRCYSQSEIDELKNQFHVGSQAPVYFDPRKPLNAVLNKKFSGYSVFISFFANLLLLSIILVPFIFLYFKRAKTEDQVNSLVAILIRRSHIDRSIRSRVK